MPSKGAASQYSDRLLIPQAKPQRESTTVGGIASANTRGFDSHPVAPEMGSPREAQGLCPPRIRPPRETEARQDPPREGSRPQSRSVHTRACRVVLTQRQTSF